MILASPLQFDGADYYAAISHSNLKDVINDPLFFLLYKSDFETFFNDFLHDRTTSEYNRFYQPDKMKANYEELKFLNDSRNGVSYFTWLLNDFYQLLLRRSPFTLQRQVINSLVTSYDYSYNNYNRGFLININTIIVECLKGYNLAPVDLMIDGVLIFKIYPGERLTLPVSNFRNFYFQGGLLNFTVTTKVLPFSRQQLDFTRQVFTGTTNAGASTPRADEKHFKLSVEFKTHYYTYPFYDYTTVAYAAGQFIPLEIDTYSLYYPSTFLNNSLMTTHKAVGYKAAIFLPGQTVDFVGHWPLTLENDSLLNLFSMNDFMVYTPLPVYNGPARSMSKITINYKMRD